MWLALLLGTDPAAASPREHRAQHALLHEELVLLVRKNAWSGVERVYLQLLALEHAGLALTHDDHLWGAMAAQARGDGMATWRRLRAAEAVESRQETRDWLAMIEVANGRVVIELSPLVFGEVAVAPVDPIVDPAAVSALAAASRELTERRRFDGLLPLGRYAVGTERFDLYGQPEAVRVVVDPGEAKGTVAQELGILRLVATRLPTDPAAFPPAAEAARAAVARLDGVASVEVVSPAPTRLYAEFSGASLDTLGLTPTDLARQIQGRLGLPDHALTVGPTAIGVPREAATAEALAALEVAFADGHIPLASVATLREAPDHTAPPPGLAVTLDAAADRDRVRADAEAVLAQVGAAEALGLATY